MYILLFDTVFKQEIPFKKRYSTALWNLCIKVPGRIEDFLIGGPNFQRGLLILPEYLFFFPDFSENSP